MPGAGEDKQTSKQAPREWYADGLRFECTQCGACCTGSAGFVRFTPEEAPAMAAAAGVDLDTFYARYTTTVDGALSLCEVQTDRGYDCVFLAWDEQAGTGLCKVHTARPMQCRTWPWWPENLQSVRSWADTAKGCEGINRGPVVPVSEIRIERARAAGS